MGCSCYCVDLSSYSESERARLLDLLDSYCHVPANEYTEPSKFIFGYFWDDPRSISEVSGIPEDKIQKK